MKTNIYIDAANIILSARDQGMDFDMVRLITYLKNKYKADKIIYMYQIIDVLHKMEILDTDLPV